jgi:hypothetical protein
VASVLFAVSGFPPVLLLDASCSQQASGVNLPKQPWDQETVAMIIRMTGGNFRLLNRLLTQIERVLEINALREVTKAAVEAARQSLVIGEA